MARAKALLAGLLAGVSVILLAACQSDPASTADPGPRGDPGVNASGQASAGGERPVIETKFGPVTPPADPQRVVALGWGDAETALALGVQPVGASDWLAFGGEGVGPWAQGMYDRPPKIIGTLEPSYEEIAALEPDLILDVKSSGDQQRHDQLAKIAPTVGIPKGGDNYVTGLDRQVMMIGTALGKQDEAEKLLADTKAEFAATAEKYPQFTGKTVTVAAYTSNGWGAYIQQTDRVQFLEKLGLKNSPAVNAARPDGFTVRVAEENLDLLDADVLVVMPIGTTAEEIEQNRIFRQVPAVQDGRYVILDDPRISKAYSTNSTLSVSDALERVPSQIAEVLQ